LHVDVSDLHIHRMRPNIGAHKDGMPNASLYRIRNNLLNVSLSG